VWGGWKRERARNDGGSNGGPGLLDSAESGSLLLTSISSALPGLAWHVSLRAVVLGCAAAAAAAVERYSPQSLT
jgi:hypothetical protein